MSDVLAADALAVECPTCSAKVRAACYYQPQAGGPYWPRAPHPERVAAARAALLATAKRSESAWLELAEIWRAASEPDQRAILAAVRVRQALPYGVDAMVRVLEHGASKHNGGKLGSAPGWTASQHAEHGHDHARSAAVAPTSRDPETGELDSAHGAAREVLATDIVDRVERGQVW